jgi:Ca-activated chloride channel family protein
MNQLFDRLQLQARPAKPRATGWTMVLDKSLGLHGAQDLVDTAGHYIDVVKLGWGSSALYPQSVLERKIQISLIRNTHNTIQVDAPQGFLKFSGTATAAIRVMEKAKYETINVQLTNSQDKYLVGFYDLELLTLPRTYQRIEITQSKTTTVTITSPGTLELKSIKNNVGQVFIDKGNGLFEWVFNLDEKLLSSKYVLQPGNYKVVYRQKDQKSTGYTVEKKFKIESTKKILLTL